MLALLQFAWYNIEVDEAMNSYLKKIIAAAVGIVIILISWKFGVPTNTAPIQKMAGETSNSLSVIAQQKNIQTLGYYAGFDVDTGTPATATDLAAQDLVFNYVLSQSNTATSTLVNPDPEALARELSSKALSDPTMKRYTVANLNMSTDRSPAAFNTYKLSVTSAIRTLIKENTVNEFAILAATVSTNDPSKLAPLAVSVIAYEKFLKTILAIPVPPEASKIHLALVQGYSAMLSGITDAQHMVDDPVRGMRGLTKYKYGMSLLTGIKPGVQ